MGSFRRPKASQIGQSGLMNYFLQSKVLCQVPFHGFVSFTKKDDFALLVVGREPAVGGEYKVLK